MQNSSPRTGQFIATPWGLRLAILAGLFISVATNDYRFAYFGDSPQTEWVQYPGEETEAVFLAGSYSEQQLPSVPMDVLVIVPRQLALHLVASQLQTAWAVRRDIFRTYQSDLLAFTPKRRRFFSAHGYA